MWQKQCRVMRGHVEAVWSWQVGCRGPEVRRWGAGMCMGHTPRKGREGVTDEVGTRGASRKRGVSASQMSPVHTMRAGACR